MFMSIHESMFVILKQRKLIGIHLGKITIISLGFRQGKWHFKERKRNGQKQKGKSQMKPKVKFQVQGRLSKSCLLRSNETRNGLALCFALFLCVFALYVYQFLPFMCVNNCPQSYEKCPNFHPLCLKRKCNLKL